jgi:hypothetical protein
VHNSSHWVTLKLVGQALSHVRSSSSSGSSPANAGSPADRGGRLSPAAGAPTLRSSRDAIGAKVFLTAGGVRQRGDVFSGASYASSSDPRVHFGLGSASKVDKLEIFWPSGLREEITLPYIDCIVQISEGKGPVTTVIH